MYLHLVNKKCKEVYLKLGQDDEAYYYFALNGRNPEHPDYKFLEELGIKPYYADATPYGNYDYDYKIAKKDMFELSKKCITLALCEI